MTSKSRILPSHPLLPSHGDFYLPEVGGRWCDVPVLPAKLQTDHMGIKTCHCAEVLYKKPQIPGPRPFGDDNAIRSYQAKTSAHAASEVRVGWYLIMRGFLRGALKM